MIVLLALTVAQGVSSEPRAIDDAVTAPRIQMVDVTAPSGIDFTTTSGSTPSTQILEVKGGGIALIDFDNDGDFDLFFPNGATLHEPSKGPGARLYENLGACKFRDVTAGSGLNHHGWSFGSAVGDYDGDGFDDIYVACAGPDRLFRNLGSGRFDDVSTVAGIGNEKLWGTSAAFADLDGDHDLDIYVTNYVECDPAKPIPPAHFRGLEVINGPRGLPAQPDLLYENLGNGTFADRSESSGIRTPTASYGLNVAILDLTADGRPDIFVGNDSRSNFLFENLDEWKFRDIGARSGTSTNIEGAEQATMGIAIGDVNADGQADIFTTNFSDDTNTLHVSRPDGFFDDRTAQYGVGAPSRPRCGWGAAFVDLDHDGDEDLFIVNGHVYPQATHGTMNSAYRQLPLVMSRDGDRFTVLQDPLQPWLNQPACDRSAVFADLDSDGDQDAVVSGLNQPVRVIQNSHPPAQDWAVIALDDQAHPMNRHAIGARIAIECGGKTQTRYFIGGGPFQSNAPAQAHFGLPLDWTAGARTIAVTITWPDGEVTKTAVPLGARTVVQRPSKQR
ncbi:MAG: CRTAC1 family protein [Phycisphaerales bacterium]|nr:CRTAC1 family protein [Phycisphaerales bacterium]